MRILHTAVTKISLRRFKKKNRHIGYSSDVSESLDTSVLFSPPNVGLKLQHPCRKIWNRSKVTIL